MAAQPRPTDPEAWRLRQAPTPALKRGALHAIPVGIAVLVELLLDSDLTGAVAIGALLTGFVAFDAPGRIRFFWQTLTAPLIGLSAAIGVLSTEPAVLAAVTMTAIGVAGGFCVAVSPRLAIAAMNVVLALLIAQGQFLAPADAPYALLLGTIGGLWQAFFALLAWGLWDREDEPYDLIGATRAARAALATNLTLASPSFRHALRWGTALGLGVAVYRTFGFDDHGYWVPLTVLFVLKPDPGQTVERILMRAAGTVIGLVIATGLAELLVNDPVPVAIALTASAAVCYAFLAIEYAIFTGAVTIFVVLLTDALGESAFQAADERGLGTGVGILIAALAVLAWPERGSIEPLPAAGAAAGPDPR